MILFFRDDCGCWGYAVVMVPVGDTDTDDMYGAGRVTVGRGLTDADLCVLQELLRPVCYKNCCCWD